MPRASARRSSSAAASPSRSWPAVSRTPAGSSATASSRPSWIRSATSCCWAPSCRFRSIRCRSASWAWTSRRRDARRSSIVALQLGGQPGVAQHQAGLRSELGQQLVLGRGHRLAGRLDDGQRAEQLAGVPDRYGPANRPQVRQPARPRTRPAARRQRHRRGRPAAVRRPRPDHLRPQLTAYADPDPDLDRASGPGQHRRHPVEHQAGVQLTAHVLGKVGEHLVRRGPLSVDQPVGDPLRPLPHRLEQQGHGHRCGHRQPRAAAAVPGQRPDPDHDRDVHARQHGRQQPVLHRPADDHVDLVQPVLEDGQRDDRGGAEQRDRRHDRVGDGHGERRAAMVGGQRQQGYRLEHQPGQHDQHDPLDLLPGLDGAGPVADHQPGQAPRPG